VYRHAITTYGNFYKDIDSFVPESFTTPTTARAARINAPILEDVRDNPWLLVIWHDDPIQNYIMDCGGVLVYT
jgi:hypothetical protein